MKAISLLQPWATLVAIGAKRVETRSWSTSYRGMLAIHASAGKQDYMSIRMTEPYCSALYGQPVPFGKIVAVCELIAVREIRFDPDKFVGWEWRNKAGRTRLHELTEQERAFGDYRPGRWAWLLDNIKRLDQPVPAKGKLGLWEWDVTVTCHNDFIVCHKMDLG
jgi:activating signal cointegrator 1